jgi:hypothetical protein
MFLTLLKLSARPPGPRPQFATVEHSASTRRLAATK